MMRAISLAFSFLIFYLGGSLSATAFNEKELIVIGEYEKFVELELIDCIVGVDVVEHQMGNSGFDEEELQAVAYNKSIMLEALYRKSGVDYKVEELHPKSTFHISGLYFNDSERHLEYQELVVKSCAQQTERITKLLDSEDQ